MRAGIIEDKLSWNTRRKNDVHMVFASLPSGELAYVPVVYTDATLSGKVYDISHGDEQAVTVYADDIKTLCRKGSVTRIRIGGGSHTDANGMLLRPTSYVAVHSDLAKLLRLDLEAPTVQHVKMDEWRVGADVPIIGKRERVI